LKLLVVGAGSVGRRHAANAAALAQAGVFDVDGSRCREVAARVGATAFNTFEDALAWRPDAAVVATPHTGHVPVAQALVEAGAHVLVEKPIAHRAEEAEALLARARAAGRRVFVVCNMRFHLGPATLKRRLTAIGRPLFARAHFGEWLPDMRPGVDYRELYCARAERGGSLTLDGVHEIDYLVWLFGDIARGIAHTGKLSDLDIDVEDYAALTLVHENGVRAEVHLDYLQRVKRRGCEVVGTEGTLLWQSEGKSPETCVVRLFDRAQQRWRTLVETASVDGDAMYRTLMEHYVDAVSSDTAPEALLEGATALRELRVMLGARDLPSRAGRDGRIRSMG
jgi:predicted dehydrogenase